MSQFLEGRFTILKEDLALYPHTWLGPVTYVRTDVTKWATQCLAWGSTLHTVEAINEQFHACFIVTVGQFEKHIQNKIASFIRISYFISNENRMHDDTVPYCKTPERKFPLLLCGS